MKSTVAYLKEPRTWDYNLSHFNAISEHNFQYYTNDVEGIVVKWRGVWTAWVDVRKFLQSLPELKMKGAY